MYMYMACTLLTLRFLSVEPLTTVAPSNWEHQTPPVWPVRVRRCCARRVRKRLVTPHEEQIQHFAFFLTSMVHMCVLIRCALPLDLIPPTFPVMEFHTRSVLSSDPLTIRLPENCRHVTWEDKNCHCGRPVSNRTTWTRSKECYRMISQCCYVYHAFIPHGHRAPWVSSVYVGESYPGVSSCTLSGASSDTSTTRDKQQMDMNVTFPWATTTGTLVGEPVETENVLWFLVSSTVIGPNLKISPPSFWIKLLQRVFCWPLH